MLKKEIQELLKEFNKPFISFKKKINSLESPIIEVEEFISINGTDFNISVIMDDVNELTLEGTKEENVYFYNLCFAEIEKTNKREIYLKNNFPSFYKLQKMFENQNSEILVGPEVYLNEEENEKFDSVINFKNFIEKKYNKETIKELLKLFYEEIKTYIKNLKVYEIDNSGILKVFSNGGRKQDILLKTKKGILYKISILSESYESQSYGKLYVKDETGFTLIKNINPKRDYRIDISSQDRFDKNSFDKIIEDFKKLIEKIEG